MYEYCMNVFVAFVSYLVCIANVDAAKEWRESYPEFKRKVARCVRKSQEEC